VVVGSALPDVVRLRLRPSNIFDGPSDAESPGEGVLAPLLSPFVSPSGMSACGEGEKVETNGVLTYLGECSRASVEMAIVGAAFVEDADDLAKRVGRPDTLEDALERVEAGRARLLVTAGFIREWEWPDEVRLRGMKVVIPRGEGWGEDSGELTASGEAACASSLESEDGPLSGLAAILGGRSFGDAIGAGEITGSWGGEEPVRGDGGFGALWEAP